MAKQIKRRRGTTIDHSSGFIGANGEITVDTDKYTLVVHDDITIGGWPLLREDLSNVDLVTFNSVIESTAIGTLVDANAIQIETNRVGILSLAAASTKIEDSSGDTFVDTALNANVVDIWASDGEGVSRPVAAFIASSLAILGEKLTFSNDNAKSTIAATNILGTTPVDLVLKSQSTGDIFFNGAVKVGAPGTISTIDDNSLAISSGDGITANAGHLVLRGGNGTASFISGDVDIQGGTGGGAPGHVKINGLKYPTTDGSNNDVLVTDGSGNLSFTTIVSGGLNDLIDDTTPQFGGDLDVNGNSIVSVSNGDIAITPDGSGSVVLDGLSWPQTDGSAGQVLETDGAGNLNFVTSVAALALENVVEDTAPQLGGNLDVNGFNITMTSAETVDGRVLSDDGTKLDGIDINANNYSHPDHTGAVTSTGDGDTVIADDAVTYAKIQNVVADDRLLGNVSGAGQPVAELDQTTVLTFLGVEAGATADQTAGDIRGLGFFDITNDGTGSGLDADLLDGSEGSTFAKKADNNTYTKAQRGDPVTIASNATIEPDFDAGNNFEIDTIQTNFTLDNPTNMTNAAGQSGAIVIVQDGGGSNLLTAKGTFWKFPGGTLPTLSTAPGAVDTITYYVRNSTFIVANVVLDAQ